MNTKQKRKAREWDRFRLKNLDKKTRGGGKKGKGTKRPKNRRAWSPSISLRRNPLKLLRKKKNANRGQGPRSRAVEQPPRNSMTGKKKKAGIPIQKQNTRRCEKKNLIPRKVKLKAERHAGTTARPVEGTSSSLKTREKKKTAGKRKGMKMSVCNQGEGSDQPAKSRGASLSAKQTERKQSRSRANFERRRKASNRGSEKNEQFPKNSKAVTLGGESVTRTATAEHGEIKLSRTTSSRR